MVALLCVVLLPVDAGDLDAPDPLVAELKRDVGFLASDSLGGRERGREGAFATAAFLAGQLRSLGWQPFEGAYRHEFEHRFRPKRSEEEELRRLQNVVAVSRPLRTGDAAVVLGAHYDHVGSGLSGGTFGPKGLIHNGADDNASGTAAVLHIARSLARDPLPARSRPVVVIFFDGEEGGLLGSRHFVAEHVAARPERFAAMVNLDMVGQLHRDVVYVWGEQTAAFAPVLTRAGRRHALRLDRRAEHIKRSDHWPFFDAGVPYLMLHTGLHPRYHRPADDADQINYRGLARVTRATERIVRELADPSIDLTPRSVGRALPIVPSPPWQPADETPQAGRAD